MLYGISPEHPQAHVVTKAKLAENQTPNTITRTRDFFQFAPVPGVMMLDHDGVQDGQRTDARPTAVQADRRSAYAGDAAMLWRPSASSGITARMGGSLLVLVGSAFTSRCDASQIPAAGKALIDLLWSAGVGWIRIGAAGQTLERTLVDASSGSLSVWISPRLLCSPTD
jgi:hypothetical protein